MVQFDPYSNPDRDPKYDFKEPDGRRPSSFWGDLAKGAADLLDKGVKGLDTATKLTLDDATSDMVTSLRNQNIHEYKQLAGNMLAVSEEGSQSPTGGATGGQSPNSPIPTDEYGNRVGGLPTGTVPGPIKQDLRAIDKMNEAVGQGQFDKERFYGEIQSRTASMISKYPGYSDYIQSKVTHYLGTDPANAQREALQQTIRQFLGSAGNTTQRDTYLAEIRKGAEYFGGSWLAAASLANTPAEQLHFRAQIADRQAVEKSQDRALKDLQLKSAMNTAQESDYFKHATGSLDTLFSNMHDNTLMYGASANGLKFSGNRSQMLDAIAEQQRTGVVDPEKNQAMAMGYGQLETAFFNDFNREMARAQFNPVVGPVPNFGQYQDSYNTLLPPNKIEELRKRYADQFGTIKNQLGAGLTSVATTMADLVTRQKDSTTATLMRNQLFRTLSATSAAVGQAANVIFSDANMQQLWKPQGELGRFFLEVSAGKTLTGGAADQNALDQQLKLYTQAATEKKMADTDPPPEYVRATVDTLKTILTHPDKRVGLKERVNAAEVISNPGTIEFFGLLKAQHRPLAYADLFAPDVTSYIKDHMGTEVWQRYRDTVEKSFVAVSNTYLADINKTIVENRNIVFKWDDKAQQINAFNKFGKNLDSFVQPAGDPAMAVKDKVNLLLKPLIGVLKEEGKVVTPEYLESIGLNLKGPPAPTPTVKSVLDSLKTIPVEPSKEDTGKKVIPKVPREPAPGDLSTPPAAPPAPTAPLKGDGGNGGNPKDTYGLSNADIERHMGRSLFINGTPIVDLKEKRKVLESIVKDKEGYHYYRVGNNWIPVGI